MKNFSQRMGLKPVKSVLQVKAIDVDLRNRLWNLISDFYWPKPPHVLSLDPRLHAFIRAFWHDFFKWSYESFPLIWRDAQIKIDDYFFTVQWNEVYDLVEFVANERTFRQEIGQRFVSACNNLFEQEMSGYRFVGREITPITSPEEVATIEKALDMPHRLQPVSDHLRRALELLSDRKNPDYRNSIKESISAVEAISKIVSKKPKATLGDALKTLSNMGVMHPALQSAFDKLYGYTSDAEGIRHSLMGESNLQSEDALFMLVSCSAFVNFVIAKCARAGVNL